MWKCRPCLSCPQFSAVVFYLVLRPQSGREPFLEGLWVDILCTQLSYICFICVLSGVIGLEWVGMMSRGTKKVENHCSP